MSECLYLQIRRKYYAKDVPRLKRTLSDDGTHCLLFL